MTNVRRDPIIARSMALQTFFFLTVIHSRSTFIISGLSRHTLAIIFHPPGKNVKFKNNHIISRRRNGNDEISSSILSCSFFRRLLPRYVKSTALSIYLSLFSPSLSLSQRSIDHQIRLPPLTIVTFQGSARRRTRTVPTTVIVVRFLSHLSKHFYGTFFLVQATPLRLFCFPFYWENKRIDFFSFLSFRDIFFFGCYMVMFELEKKIFVLAILD